MIRCRAHLSRGEWDDSGIQMASPVYCAGGLYFFQRRAGIVTCVDAITGEKKIPITRSWCKVFLGLTLDRWAIRLCARFQWTNARDRARRFRSPSSRLILSMIRCPGQPRRSPTEKSICAPSTISTPSAARRTNQPISVPGRALILVLPQQTRHVRSATGSTKSSKNTKCLCVLVAGWVILPAAFSAKTPTSSPFDFCHLQLKRLSIGLAT